MPSQYSDLSSRSVTECSAQNDVGTVSVVASHVTARAPFSQNSARVRWPGSGHAQLMQSKPSFWFILLSSFSERLGPSSPTAYDIALVTPGSPAAHDSGGWTVIRSYDGSSTGGLRGTRRDLDSTRSGRE